MDKETKRMVELAIAWYGPLFVVGYIVFWAIMDHNVPPPSVMGLTPERLISAYYGKYPRDIAIGMVDCCVFGLLCLPWTLLLASTLRDEHGGMSVFSLIEAAGGTLTAWLLAFCPAMWALFAIFATTLEPASIQFMHVMTWIIYDCTFLITTVQLLGLGGYTVLNKKQTIYPRWAGWCSITVGIMFFPLVLITFLAEGPLKLAGVSYFFIVFGAWLIGFFIPYSYFMLKEFMKETELFPANAY